MGRRTNQGRQRRLGAVEISFGFMMGGVELVPVDIPEAIFGPPEQSCAEALKETATSRSGSSPSRDFPPPPPSHRATPPPLLKVGAAAVPNVPVLWSEVLARRDLQAMNPVIPFEGSVAARKAVATVLGRAEAGEAIRVSVFGASHTDADYFTGQLRRILQDRYGDGGHGWSWMAERYSGERANDLNLCSTSTWRSDWVGRSNGRGDGWYGFAGASNSSGDPTDFAWVETTRENPLGRLWSRARLFVLGAPAGGGLSVQLDDVQVRNISTQRAEPGLIEVSLAFPEGPHRLTVRPVGDGEVRLFGVSVEREGQGVIVDSIGIRGRQARSWLSWDEVQHLAGLGRLQSDVVVLAYGTNEAADETQSMAQVEADLELVISRVRRGLPEAACVVVGPTDRGVVVQSGKRYQVWGRTVAVAEAQRKVALRNGCVFWDWQAVMGGPGGMLDWYAAVPPLGASDLIHLSQAGYQRSADLFVAALDQLMVEPLSTP